MKTHGNLKSYTCLVDSRWTVKISFFGLESLTGGVNATIGEDERHYSDLLWVAPELLRMSGAASTGGTGKGDVYSFGIMLQEILFRNSPFFDSDIPAEGESIYSNSKQPPDNFCCCLITVSYVKVILLKYK